MKQNLSGKSNTPNHICRILFNLLTALIFTATSCCAAAAETDLETLLENVVIDPSSSPNTPLVQVAANEPDRHRIYKSDTKTVKASEQDEDILSNPGNLALLALTGVAIGSAAYIATNYEEVKIPTVSITSPVENEEVFTITAIQGTSENYKDGDHVVIYIQEHGSDEWIEQEGYGGVNPNSGFWIVRFCQFGSFGPGDIGKKYRFRATMYTYKNKFLAETMVETVIRK